MSDVLRRYREQHPEYAEVDDNRLARALHTRNYPQLSWEEFSARVGLGQEPSAPPQVRVADPASQAYLDARGEQPQDAYQRSGAPMSAPTEISPAGRPMRNVTPQPQGVTPIQRASTMLRGATMNLNDELGGATAAVIEGGRAALEGDLANIAPRARGAFDTQAARIRGLTEDYQRQQPVGAAADEIGGALATGGLGLARQGAARAAQAAPTMIQQMGRGGATGAAYGYGYGFNDQGSLAERAQAGNRGAAAGAAFGAAAPPIVTGASLAVQAAGRALPNVRVDPSRVGAFGGNLTMQRPAQGPRPPSGPVRRGLTLADRARLDAGALSARAADAPEQAAVVDLFGDAGVRQLRPIAQAPGRTGDTAAAVADQRFADAPDVIMGALRRHLQVGESRSQALQRLAREYDGTAANLYRPLFAQPATAQQRQQYQQFVEPLLEDPVMADAIRRAENIFARERRLGLVEGEAADNLPRYLHYIKMGLDDAIGAARREGTGIQRTEMRGVMEMRSRFLEAIDQIVPGYRQARSQWAGLAAAEEALDTGASWVRMLPDEVAASRAQMTPFEIEHARVGLADEIRRMTSGNVVGHRNVANALNGRDMQMAIANAFDTPEQAADFLGTVNSTNRLLRNAQAWGSGSQTQGNQAYEADGVAAAVADYGGDLISGRWGQAVNRAGRQVGNLITNNAVERSNNAFGEQLLRPATSDEGRAFVAELIRIMQQREATRAGSDAASRAGAAITGQQTSSRRD